LTSIVMIFEMTLDYNVIIPMTITVAISYAVRSVFEKDTIYTKKLTRRGHYAPVALQVNYHQLRRASELMEKKFGIVSESTIPAEFVRMIGERDRFSIYLLTDSAGTVRSYVNAEKYDIIEMDRAVKSMGDYGSCDFIVVGENDRLSDIVAGMRSHQAAIAMVVSDTNEASAGNVIGVINERKLLDALAANNELFYARSE
jgi:CIC family chloride channel protein